MSIFKDETVTTVLDFFQNIVRGIVLLAFGFGAGFVWGRYPNIIKEIFALFSNL